MGVFARPELDGHEHVSFFTDRSAGLQAIVAIHRTGALGTAGGGCRLWPYRDDEEALRDVLRLSRAMTYKMALVDLPVGGAKAVVMGDPHALEGAAREALFRALGRMVDRLGGRFIISEDVGTTPEDLGHMARETKWVNLHRGGLADSATATAYAVFVGIRTSVERRLDRSLEGVRVAIQGTGRVGHRLAGHLAEAGARIVVTDLDRARAGETARAFGARAVAPDDIFDADVDVFSPCALADAITPDTAPRLRCRVVAGAANNQLAEPALADGLARRGILYAPDVAINAGGALGAAAGLFADDDTIRQKLDGIGPLLRQVFDRAAHDRISTQAAAEALAVERLRALGATP